MLLLVLPSALNGRYTRIIVVKNPANCPSVRVPALQRSTATRTTATTATAPSASINGSRQRLIRATRMKIRNSRLSSRLKRMRS